MRLFSILLYLFTLIPLSDGCSSEECQIEVSASNRVVVHSDCCTPEPAHHCDFGGHHHLLEQCSSSIYSLQRVEDESIRRAPVAVTARRYEFLFTDTPFRAPPLSKTELPTHTPYQLALVALSVIRC